jgi:transposase
VFKVIPVPVKRQVLEQIKNGATVKQMADQFQISVKTIYGWLTKESASQVSLTEYSKLKREKEDLLKIIGEITLELTRSKNKKPGH